MDCQFTVERVGEGRSRWGIEGYGVRRYKKLYQETGMEGITKWRKSQANAVDEVIGSLMGGKLRLQRVASTPWRVNTESLDNRHTLFFISQ